MNITNKRNLHNSILYTYFIGIIILSSLHNVSGQKSISKVEYICTTKLKNGHIFDGLNTLYFTDGKSLYIHNDVPPKTTYETRGNVTIIKRGDSEGFPVYKNLHEDYLYYKSCYGSPRELFIFKEQIPQIDWEITSQTKEIDELHCIRASGTFGGREYDVWFTPDIPVSIGPYKLGGLPGLILQAHSKDEMVSYEFRLYEAITSDHPIIQKPQLGRIVTWKEFEEFIVSKLHKAESHSTSTVKVSNNDPPNDYTIEKSKFIIIGPYKRKRAQKNQ